MFRKITELFQNPLTLSNNCRIIGMFGGEFKNGNQPLELSVVIRKEENGRTKVFTLHLTPQQTADFIDQVTLLYECDGGNYKKMNVNARVVCGINYDSSSKKIRVTYADLNIMKAKTHIVSTRYHNIHRRTFIRDGYMNKQIIENLITERNEKITKFPIP